MKEGEGEGRGRVGCTELPAGGFMPAGRFMPAGPQGNRLSEYLMTWHLPACAQETKHTRAVSMGARLLRSAEGPTMAATR